MFYKSKINSKLLKGTKLNFKQLSKIISEKGFILKKKRNFFYFNELKSLYYTFSSGLVLILIFFLLPLSVNIKNDLEIVKKTVENSSKLDFQNSVFQNFVFHST